MKKPHMFSVAHLRAHADELVAAVNGTNHVVVITHNGTPRAVLQDLQSFEALRRAVSLLEKLVAERAAVLTESRAEIDSVLDQLRIT